MGKLHQDKKENVDGVGNVGDGLGKVNQEYALKVENSYLVEWEGRDGSAVHKELIVLDEGVVADVDGSSDTGNDANTANVGNNNTTDMH